MATSSSRSAQPARIPLRRNIIWLIVIIVLSLFSIWVILPDNQGIVTDTDGDGTPEINFPLHQALGLDIVGGLRVLLQAELPPGSFSIEDLREAANNVSRRVNALGVGESTVQVQGTDRILVELPGVTDPQAAVDTIQETAQLEFVNFAGLGSTAQSYEGQRILTSQQALIDQQRGEQAEGQVNPLTGQPFETVMTGAGLASAAAALSQTGNYYIQFELRPESSGLFKNYTGANIGQPMAIVLDGVVLSSPVIRAQLDGGGVIEGSFTETEAKQLALQLRSGALPIPLRVESAEQVGATLGRESVALSIRAGVIGVFVVFIFMIVYYRVPGIAAAIALGVFILFNLALFKLIPITLTMPAIAGFLISIGTAVDGNILIFERMKEELRAGCDIPTAFENGFDRAWQSIRDSNLSTIIICLILFLFGQTPGASVVSGFAVTLMIGLLVNLFTAVIVTRSVLALILIGLQKPLEKRPGLLGA
ncbi:MAG: protein translocase subunit SecD [Anaerolineae bacterium]